MEISDQAVANAVLQPADQLSCHEGSHTHGIVTICLAGRPWQRLALVLRLWGQHWSLMAPLLSCMPWLGWLLLGILWDRLLGRSLVCLVSLWPV